MSTYYSYLIDQLGDRLISEKSDKHSAMLCYLCSGNLEKTVQLWIEFNDKKKIPYETLHNIIEKITILRKATDHQDDESGIIAAKYRLNFLYFFNLIINILKVNMH